ncbi:MAG: sugar phosphate isomerase/epimerase [Chloroflexi bacterium]|nr:sugar phosphate isomerase/epimerase [Chloroflexota bacterium]
MIKYGFHCFLFTDRWSDASLGILETAKELGADSVEISGGDDVRFTPALTRRRAEVLGLELIVSPGGAWPVECDLSADDPAERTRGLAWHQRQLDLAAELGAVAYTGALYGHPGTVKRRVPPADEFSRTAEGLHRLAEHAAAIGVALALEPMSHFRTHLVNTPAQVMQLIALADHPNLRVLLDTYHLITEVRDYGQAIRTVGGRLWGLHACENDRGIPGGGLIPWGQVFAALNEVAFDGYLILETYNSSLGDFARRRGMFHDVCPDGAAFVREGFAFLQDQRACASY